MARWGCCLPEEQCWDRVRWTTADYGRRFERSPAGRSDPDVASMPLSHPNASPTATMRTEIARSSEPARLYGVSTETRRRRPKRARRGQTGTARSGRGGEIPPLDGRSDLLLEQRASRSAISTLRLTRGRLAQPRSAGGTTALMSLKVRSRVAPWFQHPTWLTGTHCAQRLTIYA